MVGFGRLSRALRRRRHTCRTCISTRNSGMVSSAEQTMVDTALMTLRTSMDFTLHLDGNRSLARLENRECENSPHPILSPTAAELRLVDIVLRCALPRPRIDRRHRHVVHHRRHHFRLRLQIAIGSLPDGPLPLLGEFCRSTERRNIHDELSAHNTRNATPKLGVVAASPGIEI